MNDAPRTYRTKTGRILTEADIETLAEEAERGYDVEQLAEPTTSRRLRVNNAVWEIERASSRAQGMAEVLAGIPAYNSLHYTLGTIVQSLDRAKNLLEVDRGTTSD